ncbi:MAG TPA: hypothetical protein VFI06_10330 [Chitinophagaceae bacterium]|nr:hypothetical protein [Chitinophagaceae bacterium]
MMRKLATVIPVLLMTLAINAQFKKGDKMVGASVGTMFFNHGNTNISTNVTVSNTSNDNFGISFNPSLGWFLNEKTAVGITPLISYSKQKVLGKSVDGKTFLKDESSRYSFGIGGFARYYLPGSTDKMRFFGQYDLWAGLGGSKSDGFEYEPAGVYVDRYDQKSSGDLSVNTGLSLGLSKFLSARTALDFSIGYKFSYTKSHPSGNFVRDYLDPNAGDETKKPDYDQAFTNHGFVFGIGFQVFLDRKK